MRSLLILFLCCCALYSAAQNDINPDITDRLSLMEQKSALRTMYNPKSVLATTGDYDLKYHRFQINIDPNVNYIQGSVTSYFEVVSNAFNEMDFELEHSMIVDSVTYQGASLSFTHATDDVLRINLASVIPQGTLDSVTVYYRGAPVGSGFGSFAKSDHNGTPIIWTLSEPYGAKDWWPCKQDLNDKIDSVDMLVTTPQLYRVASNGLLISEILNINGTKTYQWQTHYPIAAYLVGIAVTDYAYYTDYFTFSNGDSMPIVNYVYPENLAVAQSQLLVIKDIIRIYDSLLVDYPFLKEKYGHAQFGWGGGMEHQTMSFVTDFNQQLIAHECAHQWFGDKMTLGSWQDIWLNEGFATYFAAITQEVLFPQAWEGWKRSTINTVVSQPDGSVLCDDTTSVSRIFSSRLSYSKGACLLHMLRWQLGDSLFFLSLRNYLNDPALAYNYVRTSDLKYHLEQTSGQNLTRFFTQWFTGQGYPSYRITWNQQKNTFIAKIEQEQSHSSVAFFEMDVPVELKGQGHDTIVVFHHTYSGQLFTASVNFIVDTVFFDPELWLLSSHNTLTFDPSFDLNHPNPLPSQLYVFPVPAVSELKIYSNTTISLKEIEIMDIFGRPFIHKILGPSSIPYRLDIAELPAGVYMLNIKTNLGVMNKKFVKIRE